MVQMLFQWEGVAENGEPFSAAIHARNKRLMCLFDVLQHIPAFLRFIVNKLFAKPFLYQVRSP
jgi:hypothetical protein